MLNLLRDSVAVQELNLDLLLFLVVLAFHLHLFQTRWSVVSHCDKMCNARINDMSIMDMPVPTSSIVIPPPLQ